MQDMLRPEVHVTGHILVCGAATRPEALLPLVAPLRSTVLRRWRPIVILDHPAPPTGSSGADDDGSCSAAAWQELARFWGVFFVRGSVHRPADLLRANVEGASHAIVLSSLAAAGTARTATTANGGGGGTAWERADWHALVAVQQLRSVNPGLDVFTEVALPAALQYFDPLGSLIPEGEGGTTVPAYISGAALLPSMVDTMLCQSLLNRTSDQLVMQLLTQWHSGAGGYSATGASQADIQQQEQEQQGQGGEEEGRRQAGQQGRAHSHPVPPVHPRRALLLQMEVDVAAHVIYGHLFAHLLMQRRMLCIGLYRSTVTESGRRIRYVCTNPAREEQLRPGDRAIVVHSLPVDGAAQEARVPEDAWGFGGDAWGPGEQDPERERQQHREQQQLKEQQQQREQVPAAAACAAAPTQQ